MVEILLCVGIIGITGIIVALLVFFGIMPLLYILTCKDDKQVARIETWLTDRIRRW